MAIYAIGDIQGCYDALQRLLEHIDFQPGRDVVWFTGDLVNRGPQSLEVLRFVHGLGENAVCVLGNHDLHLLAVSQGIDDHRGNGDTFDALLQAADRDTLIDWLRRRPLLHHDAALGYTLVHAGLPPQWDLATARACARELEAVLRGPQWQDFLARMYGDQPDCWSPALAGQERLRFIVNSFTRLRYCDTGGRLALKHKGAPGSQPDGLLPWFTVPGRASADLHVLFGHWSTLGYRDEAGIHSLDTGCLWGGILTALRIDTAPPQRFHIDCPMFRRPKR